MNFPDLFVGALTLKTQTFEALRERSDVFLRGFMVLLFAALVAGFFGALPKAISDVTPLVTKAQVEQQARDSFERSYNGPPEMKAQFEPYAVEIAGMIYDILRLSPRAGEGARPVVALLDFVGQFLGTPFSQMWVVRLLLAGLLFQLSARLLGGRASMAQMLGLTSLAAAPQIFMSLTSLLGLIATAGNVPALDALNGVLGFVIGLWTAVVYVKATAVAQRFTIWRSIAAILLGYGLVIVVTIVVAVVFAIGLVALLVPVIRQ